MDRDSGGGCTGILHWRRIKMMALFGGKPQKKAKKQTKQNEKINEKTRKGNFKKINFKCRWFSQRRHQIVKSKSEVLRILIYTRLKINKKINLCTSFQSRSMFHLENTISQEKEMGAKTESYGESKTYHLLLTLPTSLGRLALEL